MEDAGEQERQNKASTAMVNKMKERREEMNFIYRCNFWKEFLDPDAAPTNDKELDHLVQNRIRHKLRGNPTAVDLSTIAKSFSESIQWEWIDKGKMAANVKYYCCSQKNGPDWFLIEINHFLPLGMIASSDNRVKTGWITIEILLPEGAEVYQDFPETTLKTVSHTEGFSWSVSGDVGFFGDVPTASISGSVSHSNSTSRTYNDVEIKNKSKLNKLSISYQITGEQYASTWQPNVYLIVRVPDRTIFKEEKNGKMEQSSTLKLEYHIRYMLNWLWYDPSVKDSDLKILMKKMVDAEAVTDPNRLYDDDYHSQNLDYLRSLFNTWEERKKFEVKWAPVPT